jgi:hypothetical protein
MAISTETPSMHDRRLPFRISVLAVLLLVSVIMTVVTGIKAGSLASADAGVPSVTATGRADERVTNTQFVRTQGDDPSRMNARPAFADAAATTVPPAYTTISVETTTTTEPEPTTTLPLGFDPPELTDFRLESSNITRRIFTLTAYYTVVYRPPAGSSWYRDLYYRQLGETGNGSLYTVFPLATRPSTTYSLEFRVCTPTILPGTSLIVRPCGAWIVGTGRTADQGTPAGVQEFAGTGQTSTSIDLTWGFPIPGAGYLVDNYEIRIDGLGTRTVPFDTYTYTWDGLLPGTEYQVEIRACNYSACSEFTPPITVTTLGS